MNETYNLARTKLHKAEALEDWEACIAQVETMIDQSQEPEALPELARMRKHYQRRKNEAKNALLGKLLAMFNWDTR